VKSNSQLGARLGANFQFAISILSISNPWSPVRTRSAESDSADKQLTNHRVLNYCIDFRPSHMSCFRPRSLLMNHGIESPQEETTITSKSFNEQPRACFSCAYLPDSNFLLLPLNSGHLYRLTPGHCIPSRSIQIDGYSHIGTIIFQPPFHLEALTGAVKSIPESHVQPGEPWLHQHQERRWRSLQRICWGENWEVSPEVRSTHPHTCVTSFSSRSSTMTIPMSTTSRTPPKRLGRACAVPTVACCTFGRSL
jgi:hypothetical protein